MPGDKTVPDVCRIFNSKKYYCTKDDCKDLHICFHFASGNCRFEDKCNRTHLLTTVHNKTLLKANGWHYHQLPKILKLLREKLKEPKGKEPHSVERDVEKGKTKSRNTPCACIAYNKDGCNKASCPFLHVCFGFLMGTCKLKGNCTKEHNIFQGEQNKEVLRNFGLLNAKDVYAKIREGYEARAAAKAAAIESSDGASGGATPSQPRKATQSRTTPPISLTCPICCEAFIRATTLGCAHTFCEYCVRRAKRQGQPCPLCRAPITSAVRSLVIDDTVMEWFDSQDKETQRVRRQLESERRRDAAIPQPLKAAPAAQPKSASSSQKDKLPANKKQHQHRSKSKGRGAMTAVSTTVIVKNGTVIIKNHGYDHGHH